MAQPPLAEAEQFLDAYLLFDQTFWVRLRRLVPTFLAASVLSMAWLVGAAAGSTDGAPLPRVLTGTLPKMSSNQSLAFWCVFCGLLSLIFLFSWTLHGLRAGARALDRARPLVPETAGAAPRCRVCRAALPGAGAVQRCGSCGADHLFCSGELAQPSAKKAPPIRPALRSAARRLVWWWALLPLFSLAASAVGAGLVSTTPSPWLYAVPLGWAAFDAVRFFRLRNELTLAERAARPAPAPTAQAAPSTPGAPSVAAASDHVDVLSATCTNCGGNVPIQLSRPLVCPHCSAKDSVAPDLLARIAAVRARISHRARQEQQFTDALREVTSSSLAYAAFYGPLYLILGAIVFGMFYGISGEMRDKTVPFVRFALALVPITTDDARFAWHYLYMGAWAYVLALALPAWGIARSRHIVLDTKPVPPVAPGAPPRCRCCLAELPTTGTTRRCTHCGADHLVLDDEYRHHESSLDAALKAAVSQANRSLHSALLRNMGYVSAALVMVFLSFLVAMVPASITFQLFAPAPWLYGLLGVVLLATLVSYRQAVRSLSALSTRAKN